MAEKLLTLNDRLLEQVKAAAKEADMSANSFIIEAIKQRLRYPAGDFNFLKDSSTQTTEPSTFNVMALIPVFELLYYARSCEDQATKDAAFSWSQNKVRESVKHAIQE